MSKLDVGHVRSVLSDRASHALETLEAFSSIDSTNTHLMTQPPPGSDRCRVAIADQQTSGRGRHYRRWLSAPGAGLYLSMAWSYADKPKQLSSLTLAIGVAVIDAFDSLGIEGASLKWPNDIVARDGKLGGILTEVRTDGREQVTVVTGIGINLDLPDDTEFGAESDWAHRAVDLRQIADPVPGREMLAGALINSLCDTFPRFARHGLEDFLDQWQQHDWLLDREITVDMPDRQVTGRSAGVDADGALLVATPAGTSRIISGSIVMAGPRGRPQ